MALELRDAVYSGISQQFPAIYQEDGDFLVSFVQAYYEHLDEKNDRNIPKLRDIDTTLSAFLIYYKKKFLADLPIDTQLDTRFIIKHIQDMYRRKGTQESLELLFRMFFNEDIEVFYPSTAILRPSDSIWGGDVFFEGKPVFTVDDYEVEKGQRIRGDVSLATAFVDEVIFVNFSGALIPIVYLSNLAGSFSADDGIQILTQADDGSTTVKNVGRLIAGSISSIDVNSVSAPRLPDQVVGDKVKLQSSKAGIEAEGRVTKISDTATGVIDFSIVEGGFGYVDPTTTTLTVKNDIGISNQVMVVSGTTALDIQRGDVIIANGEQLNYEGSATGTPYALTGSAKVIEYNHPLLFLYSDDYNTVKTYLNRTTIPLSGSNTGVSSNVFIESMKGAAQAQYWEAQDLIAPLILSEEFVNEFKKLKLPNQQFLAPQDTGSGKIPADNLGYFLAGDLDTTTASSTNVSTIGVNSRQVMQEYINVLNLSGNFPAFAADLYQRADVSESTRSQWRFFFNSIFLALSKVDIFPQIVVSSTKTTGPGPQTHIVNGQYYMIWDNGSGGGNWTTYGASTSGGIEGEIFQANQSFDFTTLNTTDDWAVVAQGSLSTQELQNFHLNRLRFDQLHIDSTSSLARLRDKSGSVVSYPTITTPSFNLQRYRGNLARYDSSVTDAASLEKLVYLSTIANQSFSATNRTAEFEIGALTNVETVTLIPDLIEDFADTLLDIPAGQAGGAAGTANDDYGMSGPGNENLGTAINAAFSPITLKIGTISDLKVLNSGLDYQNDVAIAIENTQISKFNKQDYKLQFEQIDFDIQAGDVITQSIQIDDLQINQTGNKIHTDPDGDGSIILESLGSVTTGTNYENSSTTFQFTTGNTKQYTVKAKFLKREGNDFFFRPISFYGFEGNISLALLRPNQEYQIVSLGNTSTADWHAIGASVTPQVGEIFTTGTQTAIDGAINPAVDKGTVTIPVIVGGIKKRLISITEDETSLPMGANAEISGNASYQSGQISELAVTKTGYRYVDREVVDVINNEPTSPNYNKKIAEATVRALGQGKTGGKWSTKTSFLSEVSKNLHDNDFYQEYSYEISSIVTPSKYEPLIKETVGVAGTKLFSKPLVNSDNPLDSDLNLEISTFDIQGVSLATIKQSGIHTPNLTSGTVYTITDLGDTTPAQWENVGASVSNETVQGAVNIVNGEYYTVTDIAGAAWNDVQYMSFEIRRDWFFFWYSMIGSATALVPDFDGNGSVTSSDLLTALRMIAGLEPMDSTFESNLNSITTGYIISNAFPSDPTYDKLGVPDIINQVKFTKLEVTVGSTFTANGNAGAGTGKVSYKNSLIVTPGYTGDTYSPQSIQVPTVTYTDLNGNSVTDLRISNYPVDNKFYMVHSIEKLADIVSNTNSSKVSMDIGDNSDAPTRSLVASFWNDIIDSSETAVDANDSNTWPRVGNVFKADSVGTLSGNNFQIGDAKLAEITDSLTTFGASDISGNTVTINNHGLLDDTIVLYNQYLGTSSGNLEGNTTANRAADYEYYYVVNVTANTFQLSKAPIGVDPNSPGDTPIDLSTITGSNHLLVRQTGINADDAILIGIQEQ